MPVSGDYAVHVREDGVQRSESRGGLVRLKRGRPYSFVLKNNSTEVAITTLTIDNKQIGMYTIPQCWFLVVDQPPHDNARSEISVHFHTPPTSDALAPVITSIYCILTHHHD